MTMLSADNPFRSWLEVSSGKLNLQDPPPWRDFRVSYDGIPLDQIDWAPESHDTSALAKQKGRASRHAFSKDRWEIEVIRAALVLRRPILITGKPGVGKSSLAYVAAHHLNLGPVLRWDINSRSTVREGVYHYDAIARLQAVTIQQKRDVGQTAPWGHDALGTQDDIGKYIRLGPVGTAILPRKLPRVLLIDEIDKSDLDLPDDLLHVLEDGEYLIPELAPLGDGRCIDVNTADGGTQPAKVTGGRLRCYEFPLIFMTSNGERDFSSAFLRRCLHLPMERPTAEELEAIVDRQLAGRVIDREKMRKIAKDMQGRLASEELTTDQFLNTFFAASYHHFNYSGDKLKPGIERATMKDVDLSPVPPEDEMRRGKVGPGS